MSPEEYDAKYGKDEELVDTEADITKDLDAMKAVAGVPIDTKAPVNDFTESLRVAAGLK